MCRHCRGRIVIVVVESGCGGCQGVEEDRTFPPGTNPTEERKHAVWI
jgi:hypothetical protein